MSGMMDRDERYQRMVERIRAGDRRDATSGNGTRQLNSTLSTQQFYSSSTSLQNRSVLPPMTQTYVAPSVAPSTSFAPSERSEFKVPGLPVRQGASSAWLKCSSRFRSSIHKLMNTPNKRTLKLAIRAIEEILDIEENSHPPIDNPGLLWDAVWQSVKEKYYSYSNIPLSSMMSSISSSNFGEKTTSDYARGTGSVLSTTSAWEDPVLGMMRPREVGPAQPNGFDQLLAEAQGRALRRRQEGDGGAAPASFENSMQAQRRDERALVVPKSKQRAPPPMPLPIDTPRTRAKASRKPAQAAAGPLATHSKPPETPMVSGRLEEEGSYTVTRAGRRVKTPVLFWRQQGNTSCMDNPYVPKGKQNLSNESKSQVAKRTAAKANPIKKAAKSGSNTTPLSTIGENTVTHPKPRQTKHRDNNSKEASIAENDKENVSIGKSATSRTVRNKNVSAPVKKSNAKNTSKDTSKVVIKDKTKPGCTEAPGVESDKENVSIGKSATSKTVRNKNVSAPVKKSNAKNTSKDASKVAEDETKPIGSKVGRKRKSQDAEDFRGSAKMKKVESPKLPAARTGFDESDDSDDDLFSAVCRPKGVVSSQVVSPNAAGILSAKKALAVSVSKETPPCKSVGQMLDLSRVSVALSSTSVAPRPKMSQVAKRVAKNIANAMKDKKLKTASKKEVAKKMIIPLGTYKEGGAVYTMQFGQEEADDWGDDEYDDTLVADDDDDDDDLS